MTDLQRLQLRAGDIRGRLAELGGLAEQTDETRAEIDKLRTEYTDVEKRASALTVASDVKTTTSTDAAGAELRGLIQRANVGEFFDAVMERRQIDGAFAELQQHHGLTFNQMPLSLLEHRAVTPGAANVGQDQQEIIGYVFPQSVSAFMGIDQPMVPAGDTVFPVLTSTLSVEALAENAAGTETTGAFAGDVLTPGRLQASFFYSREDRARFAGMDASLRENLSMGLSDGLDKQILQGTGGLLTGTVLADHDAGAITTFDNYIDQFAFGRVDGRYAATSGDVRVVMGNGSYGHAGTVYRNNNVDRTALDRLMEITGGVRVSANVPGASGDKQEAVIRLGMARDMVAPIWEGVTIIPDEVTKAASGQIVITAVMLYAVKLLRADGFYKQETQHA